MPRRVAPPAGRLRHIEIERSVQPLAVPELIVECFDRILATTAAIEDHFEQVLGGLDFKILLASAFLKYIDSELEEGAHGARKEIRVAMLLNELVFIQSAWAAAIGRPGLPQ